MFFPFIRKQKRVEEQRRWSRTWAIALCGWIGIVLGLSGCKVGPEFCRPSVALPADWEVQPQKISSGEQEEISSWWKQFESSELDLMIEHVVRSNLSLREALHRIEEARAIERATAALSRPDASASGSSLYKQFSKTGNAFIPQGSAFQLHSVGFDTSWEMDLWGKLKRLNAAAIADRKALVEAYHDLVVSLCAETARTFVEARTLQARLAIADRNMAIQAETVKLAELKHRAGLVTYLDVAQGSSEYHTTEASIPLMRQQLQQAVLRLCVLQGCVPTLRAVDQLGAGPIPEVPLALNFGVPQDLLRRRPDIRQAEQDMIRECERIGAATADLYPQLTLTGVISLDSRNINTLFIGDSLAHSIGPSLRWNLLSFGRIKNRIAAQDEKFQAAIATYREKILLATEEALGSMVAFHEESERKLALTNATFASQQAVDLALEQYRKGLVSFQPVLETQRQLLIAEESLASSRGQVILNLIRTYKAIGGGWQCPAEYSLGNPIEMATQPMSISPQKIDADGNVFR